jgi:hypothetical protein
VTYLCSDAAAHISGKVFGVQGDAVEIYRPFTSMAFITNNGRRWEPSQFVDAAQQLFDESEIVPGAENMMAKLRFSMTGRGS